MVIGVGNPFRHDDGIGPAVVAEINRLGWTAVQAVLSDGEPADLLATWTGADLAVVVDAVLCANPVPGRVHRTSVDALPDAMGSNAQSAPSSHGPSSHGLGIPDAVALATVLDCMPDRLIVLAVEAENVALGVGLSPAVAAAVPKVIKQITDELADSE